MSSEHELYDLGDFVPEHGGMLRGAKLAYKTYGSLDAERTNAIVVPSAYGGTHADSEWLIGPGNALDTDRYFIVATNLFGNGLSTSPSSHAGPEAYPHLGVYDNVRAQYRLLTERLGVARVALVTGFSMGAQQAFHWALAYPDMVERIVPVCGSARTSPHNRVFIDGAVATLQAAGPAVLGRVWAAWGLSQPFYRKELWREADTTATTLEEFVDERYGPDAFTGDPRDLRAMFWTWRNADISSRAPFNRDFPAALKAIRARAIVMPSRTDTYFPPEDSEIEVRHMPNAELRVIPSDWGHAAGGGANAEDNAFVADAIREILAPAFH
ncbi:MAG: alpha/beta fold hydrolase [Candidatus Velthaea sp.]